MNELSGKEERSDGGCLFGTGVLLVLTIASLSPILFPDILTSMWYTPLYLSTGGFLLTGFILFLIPLSDRRTKYLLLFILSSCILLLVFIFQFSISQTDDTVVKPAAWSIWLYMGYAVFLIGLFIFTLIANVRRQDKTAQNITASSLSISESRVTIGEVFLIHYLLACKEMTPIKSVSITFVYQQYSAFLSIQAGHSGCDECTLPIFEKRDVVIEPDHPFVEEVAWTIPLSLVPEEGTRKDWGLRVRVVLPKNITVTTLYPMKVKWDWPEST